MNAYELIKIHPASPKKSAFYQQAPTLCFHRGREAMVKMRANGEDKRYRDPDEMNVDKDPSEDPTPSGLEANAD